MKKLQLTFLSLTLFVVGCASFSTQTFWSEKAATDTAYAALKGWKAYFHEATNQAAFQRDTNTWHRLVTNDFQINEASRRFAASVAVTEALRLTYETNASSYVQGQIPPALAAISVQSSNLIWLITYLKGN